MKFQMKPYLDDPTVTDEALIERISEAASLELERQQKIKKSIAAKTTRTNELQVEVSRAFQEGDQSAEPPSTRRVAPKAEGTRKGATAEQTVETEVQVMVREFRAELAEVKKMLSASIGATAKSSQGYPPMARRRPLQRGCRACQEAEAGEQCNHCFRCGQEGHLSRGCRAHRQVQGNGEGSL